MNHFVCVHGHFYQPPRENPWTEVVDLEPSAMPYANWNERITAECYAPNAAPHLIRPDGSVLDFPSNYGRISFNFGPTLLSWLEDHAPVVYTAILAADRESRERFSGHGASIAQAYSHMILPLANPRDRRTQVYWGIRDFEHRFGRSPEGLWLPETAVDVATLDLLAEFGIRFTILSPFQVDRVRSLGSDRWEDVEAGRVDTRRPYEARLPSGRRIALFFYDGFLSNVAAFGGLAAGSDSLASRLAASLPTDPLEPALAHIATDGETYGHHFRGGEVVLAQALDLLAGSGRARLTVYGEYLSLYPPRWEAQILERTSWSCAHGLGRWSQDCGCRIGVQPGWNQAWREPLREALDWLSDSLAERFDAAGRMLFLDPWRTRDDAIAIVLDPRRETVEVFLRRHAAHPLAPDDLVRGWRLLEMERFAMLMYTSCGWFFDDLAGIEGRQVLRYAARALQLAEELFGAGLEEPFLLRLERAVSNDPIAGDGRRIFTSLTRPSSIPAGVPIAAPG